MRIRRKLTLASALLVSIPLIVLSIIIYNYTSINTRYQSKNNIREITKLQSDVINSVISLEKSEAKISSKNYEIINFLKKRLNNSSEVFFSLPDIEKINLQLHDLDNSDTRLKDAFIADLNGITIAYSNEAAMKLNIYERDYFQSALKGNLTISQSLVSKLDGKIIVIIASPVKDELGNVIGVFGNVINTDYFEELLSKIYLGETGYAYILDDKGIALVHPNKSLIGTDAINNEIFNIVKVNISSQNGNVHNGTYNYNGVDKYFCSSLINDFNWTLVVVQNMEEINKLPNNQLYIISMCTIIIIIISILTNFWIATTLTKPIELLNKTISRIRKGELDVVCQVTSKDEIGELSDNFNYMINQQRANYEELTVVYEEVVATQDELNNNYKELVEKEKELSLSRERYEQALEGINDAVWEWNVTNNQFIAFNKWKDITGYEPNNMNFRQLLKKAVLPEFQDALFKSIQDNVDFKTPYFTCPIKMKTGNDEIRWFIIRGKVRRNTKGRPYKFYGIISDITETKIAEEKIIHLAYFDTLTGLPNRVALFEKTDAMFNNKAVGVRGAIIFIDLDDFNNINDSFGHEIGDELIVLISKRIKMIMSVSTELFRVGGDEFVVLCSGEVNKNDIEVFVKDILKLFKEVFVIDDRKLFTTSSVGIALIPENGEDTNAIIKNADLALHEAKEQGKNTYVFYNMDMSNKLNKTLAIENAIRYGLENESFYLNYQPQIELKTNKIIGVESLIRLNSKNIGFVPPGFFIPVAEKSGLIVQLGEWILKQAISQKLIWEKEGINIERISINISSVELRKDNFLEKVEKFIISSGISPKNIEFEITESVLMDDLDKNIEKLEELRELGVRVALDDFGTGYSSFNYLRILPINVLKIDKSFIDGICKDKVQRTIVESIITMSHKMGIEVIAEGVEDVEQLKILTEFECDIIQGYVFSKPLLAEDLQNYYLNEKH